MPEPNPITGLKNQSAPLILILTGSFGHGHNTAARNLEAAFQRALGPGAAVEVVDFFDEAFPRTNGLLRRGYAFAITSAPAVWRQLYRLADGRGSSFFPLAAVGRRLKRFLDERRPAAVVTTFPGFPLLMKALYERPEERPFGFFTVVTDAISINAVWCQGDSDLLFVADRWSKEVVADEGVALDRVRAHGFPLSEAPAVMPLEAPTGPEGGRVRLLYLPTTRTAHVRATLEELLPWCRAHGAELTLVLGTHGNRLRPLVVEAVDRYALEDAVTVHGWRDDVPTLMRQSHLTITKAGGATVSETLGAQCPVLLNHVVPGQEEGNVELVHRSDCGQRIDAVHELPKWLSQILVDDDAAVWKRYRKNLEELDRAKASDRIVEDVLAGLSANL